MTTGRINQVPIVLAVPRSSPSEERKTEKTTAAKPNQNQSHIKCGSSRPARFSTNAVGVKLCLLSNKKNKGKRLQPQPTLAVVVNTVTQTNKCSGYHSIGVPCLYSRRRSNKQSNESRFKPSGFGLRTSFGRAILIHHPQLKTK